MSRHAKKHHATKKTRQALCQCIQINNLLMAFFSDQQYI